MLPPRNKSLAMNDPPLWVTSTKGWCPCTTLIPGLLIGGHSTMVGQHLCVCFSWILNLDQIWSWSLAWGKIRIQLQHIYVVILLLCVLRPIIRLLMTITSLQFGLFSRYCAWAEQDCIYHKIIGRKSCSTKLHT
jgi:hypothetical protein